MLTEERYSAILELLSKQQAVTVMELTAYLNASESTIRRDLTALHRQGRLLKVHGGATALTSYLSHDSDFNSKNDINLEEKRAIAAYAAGLVTSGDVIFLDAGSTTVLMADYLRVKDVTIVTNGLAHARSLAGAGYRVVMLGGEVKPLTEAVVGPSVIDTLRRFNFTKGFFGVNGISIDAGYTTPEVNEATVKTEALRRCRSAYVLADTAKFDAIAPLTYASLSEASIITVESRFGSSLYADYTTIIEVKKP